ncbi:hypothetical protein sync_0946 [Synechococcus sp. CC9311]|nr:hypothetical protein sync_0946 [Synechococcus sp. CC9311]
MPFSAAATGKANSRKTQKKTVLIFQLGVLLTIKQEVGNKTAVLQRFLSISQV